MEKKITPPLSSSIEKLSGSSRDFPSDKDFHFLYNFNDFKTPIKEIGEKSQSVMDSVGKSSAQLVKSDSDHDGGSNWLENVNDEILDQLDCSVDEYKKIKKSENDESDDGFQLVCGKKKKGASEIVIKGGQGYGALDVKVVSKDKKSSGNKPRVPFHIPSIPKPQDEYKIMVNNYNQPFEHVWLERSEDGTRFIHPLEKYSASNFVDKKIIDIEPAKPPPVESSPYKLVEEVKDLKELAAKLKGVNEFAVDLEHNQYRSFQGLTCLMQISTRTEDFVVDTLKLRVQIGPYLREVFKDPSKKKVMHGADRDIIWLQRDFGIYICNLFDTGQASKVLNLERHSLEYLLNHFCGVAANKEYQNADWRLRPLTKEMLRYAREDTHYLLHIYDLMRVRLLCSSSDSEYSESALLEVYQRSYDICMQLYEKDVMTDSSFLYIYGLQDANLNAQQLAVVAGLCEWRDVVARTEDESTGYILPNKTLLEIAKQMPLTTISLHQLVKLKHQYVERHLDSVVSIIKHSIQNASAYEAISEQLKEAYTEAISAGNLNVADGSEVLSPPDVPARAKGRIGAALVGATYTSSRNMFKNLPSPAQLKERRLDPKNSIHEVINEQPEGPSVSAGRYRDEQTDKDSCVPRLPKESSRTSELFMPGNMKFPYPASGAEVTVQVLRKPTGAFGALLGNSAAKRKFDAEKIVMKEFKLENNKSSMNLPFHSFSGKANGLQPAIKEPAKPLQILRPKEPDTVVATDSRLQGTIFLNDKLGEEKVHEDPKPEQNISNMSASFFEMDEEDETVSLSDLSSSFKKCFQSTQKERKATQVWKSQEPIQQFKPFEYEAGRKQAGFEDNRRRNIKEDGENRTKHAENMKKNLIKAHTEGGEESGGFQLGRRRQAFPSTGKRSATFH
ncbi:HRDC domain-containing protein [Heracleum sosnowskyi]|uniref:HRDC domain-containing protein n=1 Tax=Heracleum sosnowskyi TaxID=360622 RepID=A0AAD8IHV0_9APIA|nr:HRDC domain-containing protein [Heracleum sosnowskyi]